jgi:type IV pilus assembly protein PilP
MQRSITLLLLALLLLAGCTEKEEDIEVLIKEINATPPGPIPPLPAVVYYEPYTFDPIGLRDPFVPLRNVLLADVEVRRPTSDLQPDLTRRREILEQYPLETLTLVGNITKDRTISALVRVPEGTIYPVRLGNYLGQNFGRIVQITEAKVLIKEIVPDNFGGWMEKDAELVLSR